jgi:hypothetical protein
MSRLTTSFVLGYHGCEREVGEKILLNEAPFQPSTASWHWLGQGIYFWEADPLRAYEWAKLKRDRGECKAPFVVGAVIDLGTCLDLLFRENLELVSDSYASFVEARKLAGLPVPTNRKARNDQSDDFVLRYLDNAVIDHACKRAEEASAPFSSVRGLFEEAERLFPGSKISRKAHSQICVRDSSCIKAVCLPTDFSYPQ